MLVIYVVTFLLRMVAWGVSTSIPGNKALVIAGYFYCLNTMILTLRVFGHLMETSKATGTTHIALISIIVSKILIGLTSMVQIEMHSLVKTTKEESPTPTAAGLFKGAVFCGGNFTINISSSWSSIVAQKQQTYVSVKSKLQHAPPPGQTPGI